MANDISEFHRKLKLKEYFYCNDDLEQDDSLVRNNSYFEPPKCRNQNLDDYIETTKIIPTDGSNKKKSFNITRNERLAIDLAKDSSIVIKEADKGGGIVIMNKEFYKRKILQMLEDKSFYKKVEK